MRTGYCACPTDWSSKKNPVRGLLLEKGHSRFPSFDAIIKKGIDSGVFGDINTDEATKILMSVLRGYVVSIVIDPENLFDPDACADILLNGLIKRDGGDRKVTSNED